MTTRVSLRNDWVPENQHKASVDDKEEENAKEEVEDIPKTSPEPVQNVGDASLTLNRTIRLYNLANYSFGTKDAIPTGHT